MASPILLRNRLFAGELDAEAISSYMEQAETGLSDVAFAVRTGRGKAMLDRLMWHLSVHPAKIVDGMVQHPEYAATLFAYLPAPEMFHLFAAVEEVDATLLPLCVERAPGALRAIAKERFSFVGAMAKLCNLLTCCQTVRTNQPSI